MCTALKIITRQLYDRPLYKKPQQGFSFMVYQHFIKKILLLTCLLVSQYSNAQVLTLFAEHYPPYTIDFKANPSIPKAEDQALASGMDIELIRAAYASMGHEAKFEFRPWKRVMRNVELGHALGGISCRKTPERFKFANFSEPLSQTRMVFVTNTKFERNIPRSIEDLAKLKVVIVSGYSQQSMLESRNIKHSLASSVTQGINLVKHRDQDVFFSSWEGTAYEAQRLGLRDELLFSLPVENNTKTYHVCFSKKFPESDKWLSILNKGLIRIKEQGIMKQIRYKYGIKH